MLNEPYTIELPSSDIDLTSDELDLVLGGSSVPSGAQLAPPPPPVTYDEASLIPSWLVRIAITQGLQYLAGHIAGPEGPDPNPGSGSHGASGQGSSGDGGGGGAGGASGN